MRGFLVAVGVGVLACCGTAQATVPYPPRLPAGANQGPNELTGGTAWKFASTPEDGNLLINAQAAELNGVRGAHIADNANVDQAWRYTTGRSDVGIAVLDSGIEWNNRDAMNDLRKKVRLNVGELPTPRHDRAVSLEDGQDCSKYRDADDANADGVVNVVDWSCDARVQRGGKGQGPADMLDPQDVMIAFSDGKDDDKNGFVDDIAGWDFLDDDNDPFDDVQYGHGTGEARDSNAEADNGGDLGTCPNCQVVPLRVGDSFVADVNNFAQAVMYATDNGYLVIQEALGTLNQSSFARAAIEYAYSHGVTIVASAADEAAQHHNWPSSYPHVIVVNSVTKYDSTFTPQPQSYLQFNGCTNFSSKIDLAIPSSSCSSEATGRGAGMVGLIYSAAKNAGLKITPGQVKQVWASGTVGGKGVADDVNFATQPEPSCTQNLTATCADPYLGAPGNYAVVSPLAQTRRYPARKGHDQFYGYGRANMVNTLAAVSAGKLPPEVSIDSPDWFAQVDPGKATFDVAGVVDAHGGAYTCRVYVAPGSYPNNATTADTPPGDFKQVSSDACDGSARTGRLDGKLATVDVTDLKKRFPPTAGSFDGTEPGSGTQRYSGRPNIDTYGFMVKVVATAANDTTGEDERNLYLQRDHDLLPGWPKSLGGDGASSPAFADLNGDNRNELIIGSSDGLVHAFEPNGRELRGWPVKADPLPLHVGGKGFKSGAVKTARDAILASVAVGDLNGDGSPEVVAADFDGKVYAWQANGKLLWRQQSVPAYSGRPLRPFQPSRQGVRNRTQHGFFGSPVIADINGDGKPEVVAAAMDRHVYVWTGARGAPVRGFPVLVVDRSKVASVNKKTDEVTFNAAAGEALNQGAIVTTPAVGNITGDPKPEIVVGTNEEYAADSDGGINAGAVNTASINAIIATGALSLGNSRVYALRPNGTVISGWPFKVGLINTELLPVVGEGVTGSPVIGPAACPSGGSGQKVGVMPGAGISYLINGDGTSCYGKDPSNGKDIGLQTDVAVDAKKSDAFAYSAVGQPAFGNFAGGVSYVGPATGIFRALDLAVNEYQGGQDYLAAWDPSTGQFRPNFPGVMNDLQFLTGPSVGDVDGKSGEELIGGSAYLDVHAFNGSGGEAAGWPKLTSDWMVANPAIGEFGGRRVVATATRNGNLFIYRTGGDVCGPASWPKFHHDLANSGDYARDATPPGALRSVRASRSSLSVVAAGDDVLCGRAARFELAEASSKSKLTRFHAGSAKPGAAGARQTLKLSGKRGVKYVAVRAVDEQGNRGRTTVVRVRR